MIKAVIYSLFVSMLIFMFPPTVTSGESKTRTIVMFFAFNANLPAYQNFLDGFRNTLSKDSDEPYNLLIEYLDIGRSPNESYVKQLIGQYNVKLKGYHINLLLTFGPMTCTFLKKYGLEALENTPTINIDLDPPIGNLASPLLNENSIDIKLKFRIKETFRYAFELFPDRKEVEVITGNTTTDLYFTNLIKKNITGFQKSHSFSFLNGVTLDSIIQVVRKIPSTSLVIIPIYLSDKNNVPFSTPEAIRIIADNCKAPVLPIFDSFIKTRGGIGGYVFSYIHLGKETGRVTSEFLHGKQLKDVPIDTGSFYQYIFDWKQLQKWNLVGSQAIPSDSIFFNKENDFVGEYKWYILFFLLFLTGETFMVVYLIKLSRRHKEIVRQKTETEYLYHKLIREDRLSTMVELTASLSHELNQPLTAILYSAQAGRRFLDSGKLDQDQAKEIFENIIEDDKRAAELIRSVRSLMKLESRETERVNLNLIIQETLRIFNSEAIKKNIQVLLKLNTEPVFIEGDKIQLQQVVLNLMFNAAVAMETTPPERKIMEIGQQLDHKARTVMVYIRDSGPGINPAIKDKLFKPFVTTREGGFGIGLAISQTIIEKHHGIISAGNNPEGGALFSFTLQMINDE